MKDLPHQKKAREAETAAIDARILERKQEIQDLAFVLDSAQGRRVLWRIMARYRPLSEPSPTLPVGEYYNAGGQRSAALWLLCEILDTHPDAYTKMQAEQRVKGAKK